MYYPDWLYRRLPAIYLILAALALATLQLTAPLCVAVVMLVAAALLTLFWRKQSSREKFGQQSRTDWQDKKQTRRPRPD